MRVFPVFAFTSLFVAIMLTACPPSPAPIPTPPDADASPFVDQSVHFADATSQCVAACDNMDRLCGGGAQPPTCAHVMDELTNGKIQRRTTNGKPVTCGCVAAATNSIEVRGCGVGCPPQQ